MQDCIKSRTDLETALFLSHLPYRISFYKQGGWSRIADPANDFHEFLDQLQTGFTRKEIILARSRAYDELRIREMHCFQNETNYGWITFWDKAYPALLMNIFDPPPVLFWKGDRPDSFLGNGADQPFSAVVGTRKPAQISVTACGLLLEKLTGHTIVSGLARGIDRAAHLSAIKKSNPGIAVLGSGILRAGPASNLDIVHRAKKAAVPFTLISEFAPLTEARAYHFPRRNRIIAGLCERVFIMQAPLRSGALITARFALDNGRDVAVFDHDSFGKDVNEGCRNLLYDGAYPLVFEELDTRIIRSSGQAEFWVKKGYGNLKSLGNGMYYMEESQRKNM